MGVKLGKLIKSARTEAGFTQEQLARKVRSVSSSDIGKYERGEAEPTADVVKKIAVACGVTQKSLLDAMPKSSSRSSSSGSSGSSKSSMQVTATERKLVELYREASSDDKKKALSILRGTNVDADDILEGIGGIISDVIFKK